MSFLSLAPALAVSCQCAAVAVNVLPLTLTGRCDSRVKWSQHPQHRHFVRDSVTMSRGGEHHIGERTQFFRLSDYDCVGFDLDNTILRYKIDNLVKLEYDVLAKFLVEERGYAAQFLHQPLSEMDLDFLQKGLVLDYENGNVLQLAEDGSIQRAAHGTKFLNNDAVDKLYGKQRFSSCIREYSQNILESWNGPVSEKVRACLDYFDMPAALAFARCVDSLDANSTVKEVRSYDLYNDITAGLVNMFSYENFKKDTGNFFNVLKENPQLFLEKCSPAVVAWLRELKKEKIVFLVTGSYVDFASFTSKHCLGDDWQNFFDIVICLARKPGFFTGNRPFLKVSDGNPPETLPADELKFGCVYTHGNWQELYHIFKQKTGIDSPKCVYFGDNLIQDVFAVDKSTCCDTVAISEEMCCEGIKGIDNDFKILSSHSWGSYFFNGVNGECSFWSNIIQKHATVCVPNLDILAGKPLDHQIQSFSCKSPDLSQPLGFFPNTPIPYS